MKNQNTPARMLKKVLLKLWKFPWIRACIVVCILSMMGALVLQNMEAGILKNSLLSSTQQEQVLKAKDALVDQVFAQENEEKKDAKKAEENKGGIEGSARIQEGLSEVAKVFASVSIFLVKIMGMLLMFMLYWMSDLMDNTFILDGAMGDKLQIIWIFVRNIINILFAIVLVVVAFINVAGYGAGEGNYALKKFLPKMALALIAVNFTFLAARIVLDVNNVLTTAVFALPQSVPDLGQFTASSAKPLKLYAKYRCSLNITEVNQWKQELTKPNGNTPAQETTAMSGLGDTGLYELGIPIGSFFDICVADIQGSKSVTGADENGLIEMGDMNQIRTNNFVWLMATRYQGIQNIGKVPLQAKDWEALLLNAGFGFAFAIIYAAAYLAMFIILMVRVVILWICIALSPLIAVEILFPELMGGMKIGESDLKTTFINHAFVPLKMAIPMSIGFVMISQMSLVGLGDFTKSIVLTGGEFTRDGSLHRILYGVASAGLIWIGVFSASSGVYGKGLVDKIKGGVEGVGKFVGKAPFQLIPIVPVAGKMLPVSAVGSMLKTIGDTPRSIAGRLGQEAAEEWLPTKAARENRARRSVDELKQAQSSNSVNKSHIGQIVNNWGNMSSTQQREAFGVLATISGERWTANSNIQDFAGASGATMRGALNNKGLGLSDTEWNTLMGAAQPPAEKTATGGVQQITQLFDSLPDATKADGAVIGGASASTGLTTLANSGKLKEAFTEAIKTEAFRNNLLANPAALADLSSNTNGTAIAQAIYDALKKDANKYAATAETEKVKDLITQLSTLGATGTNAKDIQNS